MVRPERGGIPSLSARGLGLAFELPADEIDGEVKDVKVVRSIPELDEAAMAAVRRWRFKPGTKNGVPVATWVAIPVRFSIH